jgi:inner membrane protein
MASIFGHIAAASALGYACFPKEVRPATLLVAGFLAFAPDLDVLAFHFGVPYGSQWGHRGWTRSLVFTVILGAITGLIFNALQKKNSRGSNFRIILWFVLSAVSHPLLDMLTNGGRGCALWWPFDTARIFFPWNPILVSPLGAGAFFSEWGLKVLFSELVWIGLPALGFVMLGRLVRSAPR